MKGGRRKMRTYTETEKAKLWHLSQRLWIWKYQTLTGNQRGWMFHLKDNFPDPVRPRFISSGDVYNRHRIFSVLYPVQVQEDIIVNIPSGFMHCERCKLMGSISTFEEYNCS